MLCLRNPPRCRHALDVPPGAEVLLPEQVGKRFAQVIVNVRTTQRGCAGSSGPAWVTTSDLVIGTSSSAASPTRTPAVLPRVSCPPTRTPLARHPPRVAFLAVTTPVQAPLPPPRTRTCKAAGVRPLPHPSSPPSLPHVALCCAMLARRTRFGSNLGTCRVCVCVAPHRPRVVLVPRYACTRLTCPRVYVSLKTTKRSQLEAGGPHREKGCAGWRSCSTSGGNCSGLRRGSKEACK